MEPFAAFCLLAETHAVTHGFVFYFKLAETSFSYT